MVDSFLLDWISDSLGLGDFVVIITIFDMVDNSFLTWFSSLSFEQVKPKVVPKLTFFILTIIL